MNEMQRAAALAALAEDRVSRLSDAAREDHLRADYVDAATGEPLPYTGAHDPAAQRFLLRHFAEVVLAGVSNDFLQAHVSGILGRPVTIVGPEPDLAACPCCFHMTLPARGDYDICPVCGWEDGGDQPADTYSSVNRSTLAAYRGARGDRIVLAGRCYRRATGCGVGLPG
ncbi:CPCC family cysteine-rich protein [Stenotrophomonas rhizophila]